MDTVGDLITRIRNAALARQQLTEAPWSRMSEEVCRLLAQEGYLSKVEVVPDESRRGAAISRLRLTLAYTRRGLPMLSEIKRVSKPGRRRYSRKTGFPRVLGGYGMAIVSTSKGVMTAREALKKGLGGEVLCTVW